MVATVSGALPPRADPVATWPGGTSPARGAPDFLWRRPGGRSRRTASSRTAPARGCGPNSAMRRATLPPRAGPQRPRGGAGGDGAAGQAGFRTSGATRGEFVRRVAPLCRQGPPASRKKWIALRITASRLKRPEWSLRPGSRLRWRFPALKIVKGRTKAHVVVTGRCRAIQRDLPDGRATPRAPGVGRRGRDAPAPPVSAAPQRAAPPCA